MLLVPFVTHACKQCLDQCLVYIALAFKANEGFLLICLFVRSVTACLLFQDLLLFQALILVCTTSLTHFIQQPGFQGKRD